MSDSVAIPSRIGRYRVVDTLGQGGMGVVYAGHDDRLDREVAIKILRPSPYTTPGDLLREARAAARVAHPGICQIFEVDEEAGRPFLVMERLHGQPLSARLADGPLELPDVLELVCTLLDALAAIHDNGLVHGDLKPSNVFLTPHGMKLLDFGVARRVSGALDATVTRSLDSSLVGTPYYIAPELIRGAPPSARSDVFAVGALAFELVTGAPPFRGASVVEVLHAILTEHPPALSGSPALAAFDRIVQRALAKDPASRYPTAADMKRDIEAARGLPHDSSKPIVRNLTRLAVWPLRVLQADPEIDFLSIGLADAIGTSLARFESLVVRSIFATARAAAGTALPDTRRIGEELDVDVVLTGTLLRAGERLRVNAQLVECATGRTLWARVIEGDLQDLFALQDSVAREITASLPIGVGAADTSRLPRTTVAYRLYLRANQLAQSPSTWSVARDLYLECVREDPEFAAGWANLGRMMRVIAKFSGDWQQTAPDFSKAEEAFRRALELDPRLAIAHCYYSQLETDLGRVVDAFRRLLRAARGRQTDPELYAGLVHACRYCGLLDASLAAHELAVRLDPHVPTSILFTHWVRGDLAAVLATPVAPQDRDIQTVVLWEIGRREEARRAALEDESRFAHSPMMSGFRKAITFLVHDRFDEMVTFMDKTTGLDVGGTPRTFPDGEAMYLAGRLYARAGAVDRAMVMLNEAVGCGYYCAPLFERDPWLDGLRGQPEFSQLMATLRARQSEAIQVFAAEGGPTLLGVAIPEAVGA